MNRTNDKDKLVNNGRVEDSVTSEIRASLCYNRQNKDKSAWG